MEGIGKLCREFGALLLLDTVTSLAGTPVFWIDGTLTWRTVVLKNVSVARPALLLSPWPRGPLKSLGGGRPRWRVGIWTEHGRQNTGEATGPTPHRAREYELRPERILANRRGRRARRTLGSPQNQCESSLRRAGGTRDRLLRGQGAPASSLTTATVPDGVDSKAVSAYLLRKYNIEIAAGLGQLAGKVWRIGLMATTAVLRA